MYTLIDPGRSTVEAQLLDYLHRHGEVVNVKRLAQIDLCASYAWCLVVARRLERQGVVQITRYPSRGRPLRITLS